MNLADCVSFGAGLAARSKRPSTRLALGRCLHLGGLLEPELEPELPELELESPEPELGVELEPVELGPAVEVLEGEPEEPESELDGIGDEPEELDSEFEDVAVEDDPDELDPEFDPEEALEPELELEELEPEDPLPEFDPAPEFDDPVLGDPVAIGAALDVVAGAVFVPAGAEATTDIVAGGTSFVPTDVAPASAPPGWATTPPVMGLLPGSLASVPRTVSSTSLSMVHWGGLLLNVKKPWSEQQVGSPKGLQWQLSTTFWRAPSSQPL